MWFACGFNDCYWLYSIRYHMHILFWLRALQGVRTKQAIAELMQSPQFHQQLDAFTQVLATIISVFYRTAESELLISTWISCRQQCLSNLISGCQVIRSGQIDLSQFGMDTSGCKSSNFLLNLHFYAASLCNYLNLIYDWIEILQTNLILDVRILFIVHSQPLPSHLGPDW